MNTTGPTDFAAILIFATSASHWRRSTSADWSGRNTNPRWRRSDEAGKGRGRGARPCGRPVYGRWFRHLTAQDIILGKYPWVPFFVGSDRMSHSRRIRERCDIWLNSPP